MTDKELIIANLHQQALDALEAMQSERERAEKAEADAKHYHQKCEMLQTTMYEAEAELAAILEMKEK